MPRYGTYQGLNQGLMQGLQMGMLMKQRKQEKEAQAFQMEYKEYQDLVDKFADSKTPDSFRRMYKDRFNDLSKKIADRTGSTPVQWDGSVEAEDKQSFKELSKLLAHAPTMDPKEIRPLFNTFVEKATEDLNEKELSEFSRKAVGLLSPVMTEDMSPFQLPGTLNADTGEDQPGGSILPSEQESIVRAFMTNPNITEDERKMLKEALANRKSQTATYYMQERPGKDKETSAELERLAQQEDLGVAQKMAKTGGEGSAEGINYTDNEGVEWRVFFDKQGNEIKRTKLGPGSRRDTYQDENIRNRIVTSFNQDPNVRKTVQMDNFSSLIQDVAASDNPIGHASLETLMARASGEVGNLSEADKKPFGGSRALNEKMKQYFSELYKGKKTPENLKFISSLAEKFREVGKRKRAEIALTRSKQYAKAYKKRGWNDKDLFEMLSPDLDYEEFVESTNPKETPKTWKDLKAKKGY